MELGKTRHFLEPVVDERESASEEMKKSNVEAASKVPILSRGEIILQYEGGPYVICDKSPKDLITTYPKLAEWVHKWEAKMEDLIIVNDGIFWMDRYD